MAVIDTKTRKRKFWKSVRNILLGKNIFQIIFRVYFLVVLLGGILLYIPIAHNSWEIDATREYTFWDALFISCSAFSNTGLSMLNPSTFYTFFGQFILCILIQVGGIGLLSLFFVIWNFFKKDDEIMMNQIIMLQSERGTSKLNTSFRSIRFSVYLIFGLEILFGFLMSFWICWMPIYKQGTLPLSTFNLTYDLPEYIDAHGNYALALWQGMFCSISAVNNSGFDIFESNVSLAAFRNDWNIVFQLFSILLIIIGGIGYPLIFDYYEKMRYRAKGLKYKTSLFTKIALISYFAVLVIGLVSAYCYEYCVGDQNTLMNIPNDFSSVDQSNIHPFGVNESFNKNWIVFFNTVSTRSAGFSTIDQDVFTTGSMLNFMILMFIGGSPSSTAGGIRTTTLIVIIITIGNMIRGRSHVSIFKKTIPNETVKNSFIVFIVGLVMVVLASIMIFYLPRLAVPPNSSNEIVKPWNLIDVMYEVSSAFGTVGLSVGITRNTSLGGLIILIICMFTGQVGISNSLLAWFHKIPTSQEIKYSTEDVKIG